MDHHSPSLFALLGLADLEQFLARILKPEHRQVLELLDSREIPYLLAGNMALNFHGLPRYLETMDIYIRQEDTIPDEIHEIKGQLEISIVNTPDFPELYLRRKQYDLGSVKVSFLSLEDLESE